MLDYSFFFLKNKKLIKKTIPIINQKIIRLYLKEANKTKFKINTITKARAIICFFFDNLILFIG